jgi:hypothetical protein
MRMEADFDKQMADASGAEDLKAAAESVADEIEAFGQEFIDGAENMEAGFGHETEQSMELLEKGEAIQEIAEDIRNMEPELDEDEPEEFDQDEAIREILEDDFDGRERGDLTVDEEADLQDILKGKENDHSNEHAAWEQTNESALESFREEVLGKVGEVEF